MKVEKEIEKLKKRITLLDNQNSRFKKLLESALDVTKKSTSKTNISQEENKFLEQTIQLIENEKLQMQEDLNILSTNDENEENYTLLAVKKLENENTELKKKLKDLMDQTKLQAGEIEKLKTEHAEFKFLLTQPNTNTKWLRSILQLDESATGNASYFLSEERHKLQRKIINLERKKTELLTVMGDIGNLESDRKSVGENIKSDLEEALSNAINEVTKREYEDLNTKVLGLEQERSMLLNELQAVLDNSRREIAEEYCKLQQKILQIEMEKAELKLTLKSLNTSNIIPEEEHEVDKILTAFSNQPNLNTIKLLKNVKSEENSEVRKRFQSSTNCILL